MIFTKYSSNYRVIFYYIFLYLKFSLDIRGILIYKKIINDTWRIKGKLSEKNG